MNLKNAGNDILEDPVLFKLSSLAKEKDIPLFLVGGHIRDLLLGTHKKDYDLILPKEASSFISLIEDTLHLRFFKVGKEKLDTITFRIKKKEMSIDIALFQGRTIEEDLERRDFTVNAIAFSLRDGTFHCVEQALEDIQGRKIRAVSDHSIDLDPLRMLRAIRYLCTLAGFTLDDGLKDQIPVKRKLLSKLPGERIKMEIDQILLSPQPATGIESLYKLGLLLTLFPEMKGLETLNQSEHHHLDVLGHTLLMVQKIPWAFEWLAQKERRLLLSDENRLSLFYATLFHDIGKQDTYSVDEKGNVHFYHHQFHSCRRAGGIMERLRFSNAMREKILHLVENHMRILNLSAGVKESILKRLIHQMGEDIPLLVLHSLADKEASRGKLSVQVDEVVESYCLRILELFQQGQVVHPPSLISGEDVMALGYSPGPKVGKILNFVRQKQINGEINTREDALKVLKEKFLM